VAQKAFVRSIQKMLRWRPVTGSRPLPGVRPHTQLRRVYEGKRKAKAIKSNCFEVAEQYCALGLMRLFRVP
jgi:hypothetical protein